MKSAIINVLDDMRLLWVLWGFSLAAFLFTLMLPALLVTLVAGFYLTTFFLTFAILTTHIFKVVREKGEVDKGSLFQKDARLFHNLLTKEVTDGSAKQGERAEQQQRE